MRKASVLPAVFALSLLIPMTVVVSDRVQGLSTVNDAHFIIEEFFGGFAGTRCVGSFNAARGYWVELNLTSHGSDAYSVIIEITGASHGEVFRGEGDTFMQTVNVDFEDSYNITLSKHPFYSDVTVKGEIDVYHHEPAGTDDKASIIASSPLENTWVEKAPMHTPRCDAGVAVVNGIIYVIGGGHSYFDGTGYTLVAANSTEAYNPATDKWTEKASLPFPMDSFGVAVYQNKIYAIGGDKNFAYDPKTDNWTSKTPMPTPRSDLQASVVNGKIYLIGGVPNGSVNEVYDPETDSWTAAASMPVAVFDYASAVVDNRIYVISGASGSGTNIITLTQIYDPAADSWSSGAPIPMGVSRAAAAAVTGGKAPKAIYVVGGANGTYPLNGQYTTQIYFPDNDSWSTGASMPKDKAWLSVAVVDNALYALGGGHNIFTPDSTDNVQYTPFGYGTAQPSPATPAPSPSESPSPLPPTASPSPTQQPASIPREPPSAFLSSDAWFAIALAVIIGVISGATILLRKSRVRNSDRFWHLAL